MKEKKINDLVVFVMGDVNWLPMLCDLIPLRLPLILEIKDEIIHVVAEMKLQLC